MAVAEHVTDGIRGHRRHADCLLIERLGLRRELRDHNLAGAIDDEMLTMYAEPGQQRLLTSFDIPL